MKHKDDFILNWRDFEIEVTFYKSYFSSHEEIYGYPLSHIELQTISPPDAPLPITGTGYKSIFLPLPSIEEQGGVKTLILKELEDAAKTKEWKDEEIKQRQYSLF